LAEAEEAQYLVSQSSHDMVAGPSSEVVAAEIAAKAEGQVVVDSRRTTALAGDLGEARNLISKSQIHNLEVVLEGFGTSQWA
jgi:hypothetical protein